MHIAALARCLVRGKTLDLLEKVVVELVHGDMPVAVVVGLPGPQPFDERMGEHRADPVVALGRGAAAFEWYWYLVAAVSVTRPSPSNRCGRVGSWPPLPRIPAPNAPLWQQSSSRTTRLARLSSITSWTKSPPIPVERRWAKEVSCAMKYSWRLAEKLR